MMENKIYYLICSTPRTGSSLLCHVLFNAGIAGMKPRDREIGSELLLEFQLTREKRVYNWEEQDLVRYFENLFEETSSPNGVRGFKIMRDQMDYLTKEINKS